MDEGLSIKRHYFDENDTHKGMMYALQRTGGNDCIDDCARTDPQKLRAIARTAKRIYDCGCSFGFESETIKQIKAGRTSVQVFEVRVKGTVIRVAAHIHENWIPIYLCCLRYPSGIRQQPSQASHRPCGEHGTSRSGMRERLRFL